MVAVLESPYEGRSWAYVDMHRPKAMRKMANLMSAKKREFTFNCVKSALTCPQNKTMYILPEPLEQYIDAHSSPMNEVLNELERETKLKVLQPRMLSGPVQGRFLSMFSKLVQPKSILEIGTYTGYSAICLSEGLQPGGMLTTIDVNDELRSMVESYVGKAGLQESITLLNGDATQLIPTLPGPFDLVFIDADKKNYCLYYELVFDKVSPGGLIIADNVLWSGKVVDTDAVDKDTEAIREYNRMVQEDSRVTNVVLSVRDGLSIARKNG